MRLGRLSTRWILISIGGLLIASGIVASGGALKNQTSVSVQTPGDSMSTLALPSFPQGRPLNLSLQRWTVSTHNAVLSPFDKGFEITHANETGAPTVVVSETVGLKINASANGYLHLNYECPLGVQIVVAVGWPGWNPKTGPAILANLSKYPGLLGGFESARGIIWVNAGYPYPTIQCSGHVEEAVIRLEGTLASSGLSPIVGGLQIKAIPQTKFPSGPVLYVDSASVDDIPRSYTVIPATNGQATPITDGSEVLITPSAGAPVHEGYYPKRIFVSYYMSAAEGTDYAIFAVAKQNGTAYLFGSYEAFTHSNGSSVIGTTVDFVNGEQIRGTVEPLSTLAATLTDGQIALIFLPLNSSAIQGLRVVSAQTTWGLLAFGTSGFVTENLSQADTVLATAYLVGLTVVLPGALVIFAWWRYRKGGLNGPRDAMWILISAVAIRLALAPVTGSIDTDNFAATSSVYYSTGAFGVDWVTLPGFLYFEFVSYLPYALLRNFGFGDWGVLAHSTYAVESIFVKLPAILADLGVGVLLAKFVASYRPNLRNFVLAVYLLNPLTVYLSGVYGQYDALFVLLLLGSVYCYFVLGRQLTTGILLGMTALVNPLGFVVWIPILGGVLYRREAKSALKILSAGILTLALGLVPLLIQPGSVFQTSFERLLNAIPGDGIIGTVYPFIAFGGTYLSSVGYGLSFRYLLELSGFSLGSYFYPVAAAVAFVLVTAILLRFSSSLRHGAYGCLAYALGVVGLFQFFFPTIFLQYAVWPLAILLSLYAVTGLSRYLSLAVLNTVLAGVLYEVLVDKPIDRATGIGGELIGNLGLINSIWAMVGLVYSAFAVYLVFVAVQGMRKTKLPDVTEG